MIFKIFEFELKLFAVFLWYCIAKGTGKNFNHRLQFPCILQFTEEKFISSLEEQFILLKETFLSVTFYWDCFHFSSEAHKLSGEFLSREQEKWFDFDRVRVNYCEKVLVKVERKFKKNSSPLLDSSYGGLSYRECTVVDTDFKTKRLLLICHSFSTKISYFRSNKRKKFFFLIIFHTVSRPQSVIVE